MLGSGEAFSSGKKLVGCDVYLIMSDLVHEGDLLFLASRLQRFPSQLLQHVGNAAGVSVSVRNEPCRPPLYHIDLVDVVGLVRVPHSGTVV